ncbi:MAG: phospho-sugar mutase [Malacoplasma sp.]
MDRKLNNKIYSDWIKSNRFTETAKNHLKDLSISYIEENFKNEKMKFGTAGIRAKMGPGTLKINSITYQQMAHGFAQHIINTYGEDASVIIGHDNRMNANTYTMVCAKVLTSFGIKVFLFKNNELKATPIVSYMIIKMKLQGGIIITASHNPKDYLGFKVYNSTGGQILPHEENSISDLMPSSNLIIFQDYKERPELIFYIDDEYVNDYFSDAKACLIKTDIEATKMFPVTFTAHHGTASYDMVTFLKSLNYLNVIPVTEQCFPDSNFTNSPSSNPEDPSSFELSLKYAKKFNAKIMLAVDPDADRLAVAVLHDGVWKYLNGNEMGTIFVYYLLANKNFGATPFVVSTFVSTYLIDKICKSYGAKIYRTPTGFKWLGAKITEKLAAGENFVVAFEEAIGSLNSSINRDKDSFQAAALALEIFHEYSKKDMTLIDVLNNEIFPKFGYWAGETVSYLLSGNNWKSEMAKRFSLLCDAKIKYIDNFKIRSTHFDKEANILEWDLGKNNWIKFRLSGTEPKFKIYFNLYGESKSDVDQTLSNAKKTLDYILKSI